MRYASLRLRLDSLLPTVEKPGRYVGIERNVTRKDLATASATLALRSPTGYVGSALQDGKLAAELRAASRGSVLIRVIQRDDVKIVV